MTKTEDAFLERRLDMVQAQIAARGVEDKRVLAAMAKVPRHRFVAEEDRYQAYADHPIPIGWGQTISQPYMVAAMTELLGLQPDSRVLEVGTGSGYQTAILAELASSVFTIEVIPRLMVRAREILSELGYDNIRFRCGDGRQGWPEEAPFDGVIVTCAPDRVPDELVAQLADGGRMSIPIGPPGGVQTLYLVTKQGRRILRRPVMSVRFVPLMPSSSQYGEKG
ncbi:MAG: protein-L-isoaspartate(D-aspartate) O-methyltransferase [Anaerolineae bacterium]|nr:protein-L-isoaspartate(D-aspartate) O-methyltransferase [Anaerolineae bacterium]